MTERPNYLAELVGVFGHPVAENPTGVMQEAAFAALRLHFRYLTIEVRPADLEAAITGLRAMNMRGINLTIPHKVAVLRFLDEVRPDAALMGAVNTVVRLGDRLVGENTDGKGFMRALTEDRGVLPKGKRVVILGAGGAARAIAVELALAGAAEVTVVNRSTARGEELAELLGRKTSTKSDFVPWKGSYAVPAGTDILVNATSIGLAPRVEGKPDLKYDSLRPGLVVCDVIPAPVTPFLREARERGAEGVDGLGMLVYQGAIGFELWTGAKAPVEVMYGALATALGVERPTDRAQRP
ncbi:MAG TPA: shikimate dehydrogenase [Anaeromyxobacteraceae bacterium]|nr:shikimate dehydrogenase [Anaeromyxobacteraceae bacterium]